MKVALVLFAAAAAVMAQSVDTVSATQSGVCEPHNDHWHCPEGVAEPTTPPALVTPTGSAGSAITSSSSHSHDDDDHDHDHAASGGSTCSPHGDHWHCPSGVAKPTTPPAADAASASTCSPHGDHWHCPAGIAEPTTPPAAVAASASASTTRASGSAAGASASPSTPQATGVAAKVATGALAILGAVGAWIL
ncbi:hypothetical protein HBI07_242610 [Parastagonospora nodorum]|nr:hypothetical protein HBI07_242610 [Parastagonospora nodorum]